MDKLGNVKPAVISSAAIGNTRGAKPIVEDDSPKKNPVNTVSSNKQVSSHAKRNSTPSLNLKSPSETLKANEERVRAAVEELNKELVKLQSELGFSVDKIANDVVVTVKRKESGEVVRQIPSEAALKLSQNLKDLKGILLDEKF